MPLVSVTSTRLFDVHTRIYMHVPSHHNALTHMGEQAMPITKVFKNGNSQAVRIPADLAFDRNDMEVEIERVGDELRIRPVSFGAFSSDFMADGRGDNQETERDAL
jgi:antitoxin VapB